jgi:hypothetical protein
MPKSTGYIRTRRRPLSTHSLSECAGERERESVRSLMTVGNLRSIHATHVAHLCPFSSDQLFEARSQARLVFFAGNKTHRRLDSNRHKLLRVGHKFPLKCVAGEKLSLGNYIPSAHSQHFVLLNGGIKERKWPYAGQQSHFN